jgi:hypothetical protein
MIDYRLPENRGEYFDSLYKMNLQYGVMPGLVYLYLPELAKRYEWDMEQKLWFAFLNGMTQNPITSLRLFTRLPSVPPVEATLVNFEKWFNEEWDTLQFDTDRRYQKRDTVQAIKVYAALVAEHGSQEAMLTGKTYEELWALVSKKYYSFGRLSSFSYLEYVKIMGAGAECTDLHFEDKSGSKSHRNGMMFLFGLDHMVWDKRADNGFDGSYDLKKLVPWLNTKADEYLTEFYTKLYPHWAVGKFTLESNLCTFKNHFFGRRYPGVYADMAWERITWADEKGQDAFTLVFKDMRSQLLPAWLRWECEPNILKHFSINQRAADFPQSGHPYRGRHFL